MPKEDATKMASGDATLKYSSLGISRIETIYDPRKQGDIDILDDKDLISPAPDDIITWLQEHPYLNTSEPEPVMVGAKQGVRIDAEVVSAPKDYSNACGGEPCIILFGLDSGPGSDPGVVGFPAGGKSRLVVLKDVEGETVIIMSNAYPASEFDSFVPQAQKVLDSVEWKGA